MPFFLMVFYQRFFGKLDNKIIQGQFSALFEELDQKRKIALLYNVIFVMRRILIALVVVFLGEHPCF